MKVLTSRFLISFSAIFLVSSCQMGHIKLAEQNTKVM